ncbi:MAG TPA: hypothetical protein VGM74_03820 [Burkholderiaceae bacterium]|jgi:hypothetical protein
MNSHAINWPRWSTSTLADAGDTTPAELDALGAHVSRCNGSRGAWFTLGCVADALHGFLARRLVTSLLIAGAAIGVASIWL